MAEISIEARKRLDGLDRPVPVSVSIVAMGRSAREYLHSCTGLGDRTLMSDETWAINAMGGVIQHDLLFHMDDCKVQEARAKQRTESNVSGMTRWLKQHPRFFTSKVYPDYPGAMAFPLKEVADDLRSMYFNNTVAYAMGYAIYLRIENIYLWGCDYSYQHSHKAESGRGCMEYLIGKAQERDLHVHIPKSSTLMDLCEDDYIKPYGYDAYDVSWQVDDDGYDIRMVERERLPSPDEIERRYKNVK